MRRERPTAVVVLTPPIRSALAALRVEGPRAVELVGRWFRPRGKPPWTDSPPGAIRFGRWLVQPGADEPWPSDAGPDDARSGPLGEDVVVVRLNQDAVEITCHGGPCSVDAIAAALESAGATRVAWREWLVRQAPGQLEGEALLALTGAATQRTAAVLADQAAGALSNALREVLAALDSRCWDDARAALETLAARGALGLHLTAPWRVVLAGPANVGKSSLINRLLGFERAIVDREPGTTRDLVTARTAIAGWPVELCDTAGFRASDEPLERAGMALAGQALEGADLVLLVADATCPRGEPSWPLSGLSRQPLRIANKCDLLPADRPPVSDLSTSALTGEGLEALCEAIAARLVPEPPPPGAAVPFTPPQVAALKGALGALEQADAAGARRAIAALLETQAEGSPWQPRSRP